MTAQQAATKKKLTPKKSKRRDTRTPKQLALPHIAARRQAMMAAESKERKRLSKLRGVHPVGRVGPVHNLEDSSKYLGSTSVWALRSWIRQGLINFHRLGAGGHIMIAESELERLLHEGSVRATKAA